VCQLSKLNKQSHIRT